MNRADVKYIVVHCSATRSNMTYSPWQLDHDHRQRGMHGAGYHYYITRRGEVVQMRPLDQMGAHVRGYNRCSIGVCYEGGLDASCQPADTRTLEQRRVLYNLLLQLRHMMPWAKIVGHRDLSPDRNKDGKVSADEWLKACPSFDAIAEYRDLNEADYEYRTY